MSIFHTPSFPLEFWTISFRIPNISFHSFRVLGYKYYRNSPFHARHPTPHRLWCKCCWGRPFVEKICESESVILRGRCWYKYPRPLLPHSISILCYEWATRRCYMDSSLKNREWNEWWSHGESNSRPSRCEWEFMSDFSVVLMGFLNCCTLINSTKHLWTGTNAGHDWTWNWNYENNLSALTRHRSVRHLTPHRLWCKCCWGRRGGRGFDGF